MTPLGALVEAGGNEQLGRGIRQNDRADVSPVQHCASGCERALPLQQGRAHLGVCCDDRGEAADFRFTQIVSLKIGDFQILRQPRHTVAICGEDALLDGQRGNRAVEQAGVQMPNAVMRCQFPGDSALARGGGAVDGDDDVVVQTEVSF